MRCPGVSYAVAAVGAAAVVLAGCGGGGEDEPSDPPTSPTSSVPSPTGTPTPSAAALPEVAKERSNAGAMEFLRFWFAEVGRSQTNPGSVDFGPLSYPECKACEGTDQEQKRDFENGTYTKEPAMVIDYTSPRKVPNSGDDVYIDYTFREKPVPYYVRGQEEPEGTITEGSGERIAVLRWTDDGWKLRGMIDEAQEVQPTP